MRTRHESNYRNTPTKDGCFSPKLSRKVSRRIIRYCEQQDLNKTKFVECCVAERLDTLEREALNSMPKEMLIEMLLTEKLGG